jgi:hypothetical protein
MIPFGKRRASSATALIVDFRVEQDILALRTRTEAAARAAHGEATQAHARTLALRQAMRPQMDALQASVAQARVDYRFIKG